MTEIRYRQVLDEALYVFTGSPCHSRTNVVSRTHPDGPETHAWQGLMSNMLRVVPPGVRPGGKVKHKYS